MNQAADTACPVIIQLVTYDGRPGESRGHTANVTICTKRDHVWMRYPIFNSQRSFREGFTPAESRTRWSNYYHLHREIVHLHSIWIPRSNSIDVKTLLGIHLYEDAVVVRRIRTRLGELGLQADELYAPCVKLQKLLNFLGAIETWQEYVSAIYNVIKPMLIDAWETHFTTTDPLLDEPSTRMLHGFLRVTSQHINGGMQLVEMLIGESPEQAERIHAVTSTLRDMWPQLGPDPTQLQKLSGIVRQLCVREIDGLPGRDSFCRLEVDPQPPHNFNGHSPSSAQLARILHDRMNEKLLDAEILSLCIHRGSHLPWHVLEDLARQVWDLVRHVRAAENMLNLIEFSWGDFPIDVSRFQERSAREFDRCLPLEDELTRQNSARLYEILGVLVREKGYTKLAEGLGYLLEDERRHFRQQKSWLKALEKKPAALVKQPAI